MEKMISEVEIEAWICRENERLDRQVHDWGRKVEA